MINEIQDVTAETTEQILLLLTQHLLDIIQPLGGTTAAVHYYRATLGQ